MASDLNVPEILNRRRFLRQSFAFSAAAALSPIGTFALPPNRPARSDASHLLMLGDWGRDTKGQAQHLVAQGMIGYTKKHSLTPQALLMLGDNWYDALPGGVHSTRWQTGFEDMYPKSVFDCPAYAIPGNHDYQVMPESKLAAELEYARLGNTRWTMPSLWYRFGFPSNNPQITFIALDSNVFHENGKPEKNDYNFTLTPEQQAEQLTWLRSELEMPLTTPFFVVMAHHSIFSILNPGYPNPYPPNTDLATLPTSLVQFADETHMPYTTNYSFGAERQLAKGLTVAATYRGTIGIDLFRSRDVNAPPPQLYDVRPNPAVGVVRQIESKGRQVGNAFDFTLNGNAGRWFSGIAQYTFSHTNNNTSGITWFPANQYSLAGEYGRADFDLRHRFNLLGTINEDHWLNLGIAAKLYSGTPYTETSGNDTFNTGILNARPAGVNRNTLQTAGNAELDLRWSRDLPLRRKQTDRTPSFSIAIDAFNITNRTNYSSYVGNVQSSFFGQPTAALPARRMQFNAKIKF